MTLDERIFLCRLLEKIEEQEAYCESIGVLDRSSFQGKSFSRWKTAIQQDNERRK